MNDSPLLFTSQLVDGNKFRSYNRILLYAIPLFFIASLALSIFLEGKQLSIQVKIPIFIITWGVFISLIILNFRMYKTDSSGTLSVFKDGIQIDHSKSVFYDYNSISKFEIQRGATYHYAHEVANELIQVSNFIRLEHEGKAFQFEFIIDSQSKNNEFESMIKKLNSEKVKFYYTSI